MSRKWVRVRQLRSNTIITMFFGKHDRHPDRWTVEAFLVYENFDRTLRSEWLTIHTTSDRVEALNWAHRWTARNGESLAKQQEKEQQRTAWVR